MVEWVQSQLEAIYGFKSTLRATDYLLTTEAAKQLGGTGRSEEELLLHEGEEALEIGLYLSENLLSRANVLATSTPEQLWNESLPSFCELTEGVSHFLYVVQTAEQERRVSLLELEAQAEVDKFAMCMLMKRPEHSWLRELVHRLFDRVSYRETLSTDERRRYEEANRLARTYCSRLLPYLEKRRLAPLLQELRYTYRLGAEAKLRRLAGTA